MLVTITAITRAIVTITIVDAKNIPTTTANKNPAVTSTARRPSLSIQLANSVKRSRPSDLHDNDPPIEHVRAAAIGVARILSGVHFFLPKNLTTFLVVALKDRLEIYLQI